MGFDRSNRGPKMKINQYEQSLGVKVRNMKMDLIIYGTWRWVTFGKTNDEKRFFFIQLSRLVTP